MSNATSPKEKPSLAGGELSFDPSENVKALTEAANLRQDDLRHETNLRIDAELNCVKEIARLRADHAKELNNIREKHQSSLRKAEAERLDSIRQVDREDVNKTATSSQSAIAALAQVTTTTAETLRTQVATTAAAYSTGLASSMGEVNKRLSALELSYSEGRGKQAVESPQFAEALVEMKRLATVIAGSAGEKTGRVTQQQMFMMAVSLIVALFVIVGGIVGVAYFVRPR